MKVAGRIDPRILPRDHAGVAFDMQGAPHVGYMELAGKFVVVFPVQEAPPESPRRALALARAELERALKVVDEQLAALPPEVMH